MDKDNLAEGKEAFKQAADNEAEQRLTSLDDLRFSRLGEQWPADIERQRKIDGRPCLTINRLPAFLKQVTNDARQNKPSIKCHPVGSGADKETAEILDGLIRNIEYTSNADVAYDTALDFAATMGFGYIVVRVDYASDDSFDQDIIIEPVYNPFSIYGDPYAVGADSKDWNDGFITDVMSKTAFEKRWPKADTSSFDGNHASSSDQLWFQGNKIMVAEWWHRDEVPVKLLKLSDGAVMMEPEYLKIKDIADVTGVKVTGDRMSRTHRVVQKIMNGSEILETNPWAGRYIPIIPVYGDEINVEGRRYFQSLIRFAKDPQRNYNYWRSASTELVALAPKTPFIGAVGQFDTDAEKWATANSVNHAYIEYDPIPGMPPPERQAFAGPPAGALQEALNASDDMKNVMGIHDASLGARSNETSGKAILARQREGDVSTYNFTDNLNRAIRHLGRVVVDLIPEHYGVERIIRVIKEDGSNYSVPLKQPVIMQEGEPPQPVPPGLPPEQMEEMKGMIKVFDLAAGKYDITVAAGPSFTTRREEASEQMMEFIRVFPQAAPLIGDLLAQNLDWPGADEVAKRLKAMLPPQAAGKVDPIVQQLQQQLQQQDAHAKEAVATLQGQIADFQKQLADKQREDSIKMFEAETKRMAVTKPDAPVAQPQQDPLAIAQLEKEHRQLDIAAYEAETKRIAALGGGMTQEAVQAIARQTVMEALTAEPLNEDDKGGEIAEPAEPDEQMLSNGLMMPQMMNLEQQPAQPPGL